MTRFASLTHFVSSNRRFARRNDEANRRFNEVNPEKKLDLWTASYLAVTKTASGDVTNNFCTFFALTWRKPIPCERVCTL